MAHPAHHPAAAPEGSYAITLIVAPMTDLPAIPTASRDPDPLLVDSSGVYPLYAALPADLDLGALDDAMRSELAPRWQSGFDVESPSGDGGSLTGCVSVGDPRVRLPAPAQRWTAVRLPDGATPQVLGAVVRIASDCAGSPRPRRLRGAERGGAVRPRGEPRAHMAEADGTAHLAPKLRFFESGHIRSCSPG